MRFMDLMLCLNGTPLDLDHLESAMVLIYSNPNPHTHTNENDNNILNISNIIHYYSCVGWTKLSTIPMMSKSCCIVFYVSACTN